VGSILILVTIVSWVVTLLLRQDELTDTSRDILLVSTMSIGLFKAHLIGSHFMELKDAPRRLQATFTVWIVLVWLAVVVPNIFLSVSA
jgi:fucose permease